MPHWNLTRRQTILSSTVAFFLLFFLFPPCARADPEGPDQAAPAPIRVTNFDLGETIRHSVPLIRGEIAVDGGTEGDVELFVVNESSDRPTRRLPAHVHKGRFKALADLVPGRNDLILVAGPHRAPLVIHYKPQTNPYVVRAIYATDNSGRTEYQTPHDDDPQDYRAKLGTAMLLMQSFTAEQMHAAGLGRATFNLELDDAGQVIVHTHKGRHSADEYQAMGQIPWFDHFRQTLDEAFPYATGINVIVPAYTRFDPETREVSNHTALGGSGQALFGSGMLYAWPNGLGDVFRAFSDPRPIEHEKTLDDTAGRSTYWGAAATNIGATAHEMGHAMGLFHGRGHCDIMTRGFDHFGRVFTLVEPPRRGGDAWTEFSDDQAARWSPDAIAALRPTRWFDVDAVDYTQADRPQFHVGDEGPTLAVKSPLGIRFVGFDKGVDTHLAYSYLHDDEAPKAVSFKHTELLESLGAEGIRLRAVDARGNLQMWDVKLHVP